MILFRIKVIDSDKKKGFKVARTLINSARQQASIQSSLTMEEELDLKTGLKLTTAGDSQVRSKHSRMNGRVMTRDVATKQILNDINCRCFLAPFFLNFIDEGEVVINNKNFKKIIEDNSVL